MNKQTEALKLALEANTALREWINAVPNETVLPAMPGVDGDWLDSVDATIRKALAEQPLQLQHIRDSDAELNCAEEVLDGYAVHLELEKTAFDCIGDYIKEVCEALKKAQQQEPNIPGLEADPLAFVGGPAKTATT